MILGLVPNAHFHEFLYMRVLTHDKIKQTNSYEHFECHGLHIRPTSKRWFLKVVQVTMKHDPLDAMHDSM